MSIITLVDTFPLEKMRQPQKQALDFIYDALREGYEDIVVAAPTGIGKTGIGAAFCYWASTFSLEGYHTGGYYLVTQKMLQDQIENDFPRFGKYGPVSASLKSATEYVCKKYGNCGIGSVQKKERCVERATLHTCPYVLAYNHFKNASLAVTNYPYFFAESTYVKKLESRNALVADECHTLDKQITSSSEMVVDNKMIQDWAPHLAPLPSLRCLSEFVDWIDNTYLPVLIDRIEMLNAALEANGYSNSGMLSDFNKLDNHIKRAQQLLGCISESESNWIYWQDNEKDGLKSYAKPLFAAPFLKPLIKDRAAARLYMSAYPGPKNAYCRSIGLDKSKTAWLELDSNFPIENRPINIINAGSMSASNLDANFPGLCRIVCSILELHATDKGIIHCHSYKLGDKLNTYLSTTKYASRILYPRTSHDRRGIMQKHSRIDEPTVILSPSITEGYSFDDNLARFQIIAKVPYPYLGDKRVKARMNQDHDWYTLQAAMTILQACGRIVRSDTDYGYTYILDSDFSNLFNNNQEFFPKWLTNAFVHM
jgi:Rad3-related DNA helicase